MFPTKNAFKKPKGKTCPKKKFKRDAPSVTGAVTMHLPNNPP